ncbi:MAG: hypothetical protein MI866_13270 [Bacteroidales bacterium]|nr:hypothetical protein [Bacteroidales bacterium]
MKKRYWQQIAKALLLLCSVLAYGYIIRKLVNFEHWEILLSSFKFSGNTLLFITLLTLLWLLNLGFETKKWQALMHPFVLLSFKDAWQQVMAGTTTAVGSPARIAEMGGRMAILPRHHRLNAAIMTSIGGIIQSFIIFFCGILALLFNPGLAEQLNFPFDFFEILFGITGIVSLLLIAIRFIFPHKFKYYFRIILRTDKRALLKSLFWTSLRYLTFIIQFYFWLHLWGLSSEIAGFIALSAIYFFVITIIPSHILVDMGIRGSIAILLFTPIFSNTPLILAAAFCLWCTNVIIPTLIGSYILVRQKLIKQRVMEKET